MKKILLALCLILATCFMIACGSDTPGGDTPGGDTPGGNTSDTQGAGSVETQAEIIPGKPTYTITFIDKDGQTIETKTISETVVPTCSYAVEDTQEFDYTLEGWSTTPDGEVLSALPAVTGDATYYAIVSSVKQKYTVSFDTMGGTTIQSQVVEYGSKATKPQDPTYEGHKFMGWSQSTTAIEDVDFEAAITGNITYYAVWNEIVEVKAFLEALLSGYQLDPMSYIPETMRYDYAPNLVSPNAIVNDYSNGVNVSKVTYGFGEQWQMVLDNVNQSETFFGVLSIVETISATSVAAFNNYIDQNPADTAHYEFENGIYNVAIKFSDGMLFFVVDYTANIPALGEQTVQIALLMDVATSEKTVRVQIGDANALSYTIRENGYDFAIKYLGVRRAMISLEKDGDAVTGRIYEYLTAAGVELASCADFYVDKDYVSVVGNKASGLIGFTGTICELYDVTSGKMVGYEVNETLSKINYDTLWFNLKDINGITSIKCVTDASDNTTKLYVNGSSQAWASKNVGGIGLTMLSRRFDIEFRTQYVYSYDASTETYTVHAVQVPMLFVQESYLESLAEDVKSTNKVNVSVAVSQSKIDKLMADYKKYIPIFVNNKETISVEAIIQYIGEKITL